MRLLFDENLSRRLVARLADLYPGSRHVSDASLLQSPDATLWKFAAEAGVTIVTTDSDFFEMATSMGHPPKVIWLRRWTHPTRDAEAVLRREAIRITEFCAHQDLAVLILNK